jgi:hypothetical protein
VNVDTAFEVIDPRNKGTLFKFVLTRLSGEPRTAIAHRNLENWGELKEFLKNTYTEKRTLDFHANQLFSTKQTRAETVSEWIQQAQKLGSKFREAALQDCEPEEKSGILSLADKLRNIFFVQGLYSDRIQTIVRSRNYANFDDIAETALEEESEIFSKNERNGHANSTVDGPRCSNCHKLGHPTSRCYLRDKKNMLVSQLAANSHSQGKNYDLICYNCQGKGHMAKQFRKPKRKLEKSEFNKERTQSGNEYRPSESSSRPTVRSIQ